MGGVSRTPAEWEEVCSRITTGYAPGGKHQRRYLYEHGHKWVTETLKPLSLWGPGDVIVDIGCGNGRVAMGLVREDIEYHGVDLTEGTIEFCRMAFEPWPNFHFWHIPVHSERYNKAGTISPEDATFPIPDNFADLVLAVSLFSHLGTIPIARRYIHEARRILRPEGGFYSSWYRSPPNEVSEDMARTVYREADIINLLSGFRISETFRGIKKSAQWAIVARMIKEQR